RSDAFARLKDLDKNELIKKAKEELKNEFEAKQKINDITKLDEYYKAEKNSAFKIARWCFGITITLILIEFLLAYTSSLDLKHLYFLLPISVITVICYRKYAVYNNYARYLSHKVITIRSLEGLRNEYNDTSNPDIEKDEIRTFRDFRLGIYKDIYKDNISKTNMNKKDIPLTMLEKR
ncbi:MAG: hypothetical protein ACI9BN_001458, partial [Francisella sp.]